MAPAGPVRLRGRNAFGEERGIHSANDARARISNRIGRGCVEDQPQHARDTLRLTLRAQPRSDGVLTLTLRKER